jgi:hypothetical protein
MEAQRQTFPGGGGSNSPSSLSTFFNKYFGIAPDDCGNVGCTTPATIRYLKFCYDGVVTGQPTTTFKSLTTMTVNNTVLTNNVATYTTTGTSPTLSSGELVTVTGTTNGGGVFNVSSQPIINYNPSAATFTVAITSANVTSAADTGTATASCANFQSADATSVIEILQGGLGTALDVSTTISSVTSSSQIVLGANATTNATGKKFWYGTDDTTFLQNWVTAIDNGIPTATGLLNHSGYLPGLYLTTKPLRFVNPTATLQGSPLSATGTTPEGFGLPEPVSAANANDSLSIWGQGSYRSGIIGGSNFNWASAGTGLNTGIFYFTGWNGPNLQNFAVISPDVGIAYNTSTLTSTFGCFFDDNNGHVYLNGITIENCHNTTSNLVADQMANGTFESSRNNMQIYNSDCGGVYGGGSTPLVGQRGTTWNGVIWSGNTGGSCTNATIVIFSGTMTGWRISNSIIDNADGPVGASAGATLLRILGSTSDTDEFNLENVRLEAAGVFPLVVNNGSNVLRVACTNCNLTDTAGNAGRTLAFSAGSASQINFFGGTLACLSSGSPTACASGISNATGSTVSFHGTRMVGPVGITGTGANQVGQFFPLQNCSSSSGACGSSNNGSVSIAAAATTVTVATTAVTANSQILITEDSSLGTKLGVTCNTTTGRTYTVTARTAQTSFVITASAAPATNPACLSYSITN